MNTEIENYVLESSKWLGCRLRDLSSDELAEVHRYRPSFEDRNAVREFCRMLADRARQHRRAA